MTVTRCHTSGDLGYLTHSQQTVCDPAVQQQQGGLPFTGYDTGIALAAGVALVAMGATLHRVFRTPQDTTPKA